MSNHNTGRVISRFGAELILETDTGDQLRCTTRRKLEHVACGDFVYWQQETQGNAVVTDILTRKNALSRPDFRGRMRAIAANIDCLMVVSSWLPAPNWEMLDRYLVAAAHLPAEPLIVMNKSDLRDEQATIEQEACLDEYTQTGYQVIHTNSKSCEGIDTLRQFMDGKTAILAGQSGVGKSSLAACLLPEQAIRVGSIANTGEGRHTTTVATLYQVGNGAMIDSPGVRDFALPPLDLAELQTGYPEFVTMSEYCRFNNCTHQHEPGCAIKTAVDAGDLPQRRYQRYLSLLTSQRNN